MFLFTGKYKAKYICKNFFKAKFYKNVVYSEYKEYLEIWKLLSYIIVNRIWEKTSVKNIYIKVDKKLY